MTTGGGLRQASGPAPKPHRAPGPLARATPDSPAASRANAKADPAADLGLIKRLGCRVSEAVADVSADPLAQIGVVVGCTAWFVLGLPVEILTAFLSIMAITLSQMVLNKQNQREADAHRRDVALHAKIDELVHASKRARDEIAGIEELEEEEIERLRNAVKQQTAEDAQQENANPAAPAVETR